MARRRSGERESEQDGERESAWSHRALLAAASRLVQVRAACQGKISDAVINVAGAGGHAGADRGRGSLEGGPRRTESARVAPGDPDLRAKGGGEWRCRSG